MAESACPGCAFAILHNASDSTECITFLDFDTPVMTGHGIAKVPGMDPITCRMLAIETGIQNSAISVELAEKYFQLLQPCPVSFSVPGSTFKVRHLLASGPGTTNIEKPG